MRCDRFREAASARIDDEPIGMSAAELDRHLVTCADCARWLDEAIQLTRRSRLNSAEVPDLADAILDNAVLPARRVLRFRRWTRAALALVGVAQLGIALPSLFGASIDMAMSTHAAHESAAWNVALGAALIAAAVRPTRAAGVLPLLAAFVGVLGVLSIRDLASGAVAFGREATHLGAIAGLALVYLLARAERVSPPERPVAVDRPDRRDPGLRGAA
jgi:predicted anti-sigma-YlaC factor YlaD